MVNTKYMVFYALSTISIRVSTKFQNLEEFGGLVIEEMQHLNQHS